MNCPKCGSDEVALAGDSIVCQKCQYSFTPASTQKTAPKPPANEFGPRLVRCPACSHQVSTQAARCPSCGQPLQPQVDTGQVKADRTKAINNLRNIFALAVLAYWIWVWIDHMLKTSPAQ